MAQPGKNSRVAILNVPGGTRIIYSQRAMRSPAVQTVFTIFWIVILLIALGILAGGLWYLFNSFQSGTLSFFSVFFVSFLGLWCVLLIYAIGNQKKAAEILDVRNGFLIRRRRQLFWRKSELLHPRKDFSASFIPAVVGRGPNPDLRVHRPSYIELSLRVGPLLIAPAIDEDEAAQIIDVLEKLIPVERPS